MRVHSKENHRSASFRLLPWLHCSGVLVVVVCNALFSAIHSPLGREISAGESPGFAWIRDNILICMGIGLTVLFGVGWIQIRHLRQFSNTAKRWLLFSIFLEVLASGAIGISILFGQTAYLTPVSTVLMLTLLIQAMITFRYAGNCLIDQHSLNFGQYSEHSGLFLCLLFLIGAFVALIEPSWHRLADQVVLDSTWDVHLRYIYPALLSGAINLWIGIGMQSVA